MEPYDCDAFDVPLTLPTHATSLASSRQFASCAIILSNIPVNYL